MAIEGGDWICYKDGFRTSDMFEWNQHCGQYDPDTGTTHITYEGTTICNTCDKRIEYINLPYPPYQADGSVNISLKCKDCGGTY